MARTIMFIFTIIIFAGCKKPNPVNPESLTVIGLDAVTISYFAPCKNGSYWIYQNDQTGETDSAYISNFRNGISTIYPGSGPHSQEITFSMNWAKCGTITFEINEYSDNSGNCTCYMSFGTNNSIQIDKINGVYKGFDHAEPIPSVSIYDSTQIGSLFYKDVLFVTNNLQANETLYFAPNIGIAERTLSFGPHPGYWKLLRYKL